MDDQQRKLAEELLFGIKKTPGFGKLLYFGLFEPAHVFPFPKVSAEEQKRADALIADLKQFLSKNLDPDAIDRQAEIPSEVVQGLGKLGLLGMTIPHEYGGLGLSQHAYCRAMEELGGTCGATALFVNAHQSIGLKALLLFGTEEQRKKYLPKLARGEQLAAFSLTEPNAGSDAGGVETRAVYDPVKKVYKINGKKQWTTNGSLAKVLTVMAQTEIDTPDGKQDKVTAFLVTPDMPGFQVTEKSLEKVGMRGSWTANLAFNNMEVPEENILGTLGGGLKICLNVLDFGRTTFGATCTGAAKFALNKAIDHATHRLQFKRPLATFGLVKKKIATMSALVYAMEATTFMTAGFVDAEIEDFMLESAILKVFASDSLWSILYDTMQIYGGRSFFTSAPFERMMRDARLNMIGEGSNEVMRAFIAVVGMRDVGMQLKAVKDGVASPIENWEVLKKFAKQGIHRISSPDIPVKSPLLEQEAAQLGKSIRWFGNSVLKLLITHKEEILEKQLELDRIATSAIALYTTTAVLSRLDADLERVEGHAAKLGNDVAVAKLYCQIAFEQIEQNLSRISSNYDEQIEKLSDQITGVKFP